MLAIYVCQLILKEKGERRYFNFKKGGQLFKFLQPIKIIYGTPIVDAL